ncbi:cell-division control histidine kinase PdhS [Striga asiatica]|uniref:Cell-division control histidine kinase PdhS n=1 Tax=Striga asiatica TaxID=4170 RepID=A0A5A7PBL1_STRAF|nr:cell-division control histidine kinase PdhS [Striga asiatica]
MAFAMFFSSPVFPAFAPPKLLRLRPFSSSFSGKQFLCPAAPLPPIVTHRKKKVGPLPVTMSMKFPIPEVIETEDAIVALISVPGVVSLDDVKYLVMGDKLAICAESSALDTDSRAKLGFITYSAILELNGADRQMQKFLGHICLRNVHHRKKSSWLLVASTVEHLKAEQARGGFCSGDDVSLNFRQKGRRKAKASI